MSMGAESDTAVSTDCDGFPFPPTRYHHLLQLNYLLFQVAVIFCGLSYQQPLKVRTGRLFVVNIVFHEYFH